MNLNRLDEEVQEYCRLGLVLSTNRVYMTAVRHFSAFCTRYHFTQPFPVNELLLCRFVVVLAREGLAPAKTRAYLAGIRHAQIMRGFLEPAHAGSLPHLKLVQAGVTRSRLTSGHPETR